MSEILDQSEIDALMSAVKSGEVEETHEHVQIFSRHRRDHDHIEIKDYDFKRPERITKDQIRALQTLHESFARNFSASLSGFLRTIVEVRVANVEQMTYSEFVSGLPNPTSFNLVDCELDGQICLEVSPLIIYPVIDRLLGGSNENIFIPQRPLTLIETRLIRKILDRGMTALSEAWEAIGDLQFSLGAMESNPQIVQIVPPNEVVVVIGFELKTGNRAGTMSLCIPFAVIEPVMEDLSAQSWFQSGKNRHDTQWGRLVADRIADAPIELDAVLAETTITLADLRRLEVGDVIVTEKPDASAITVQVEGVPKFLASLGQNRGARAVRIQRQIVPGERLRS